jgi:hypothetical protein
VASGGRVLAHPAAALHFTRTEPDRELFVLERFFAHDY